MVFEKFEQAQNIVTMISELKREKSDWIARIKSLSQSSVSFGDPKPITRDFTMQLAEKLIEKVQQEFDRQLSDLEQKFDEL